MPIPSNFDDLSATPDSNPPPGTESAKGVVDNYFRAAFAFIKQLYSFVQSGAGAVERPLHDKVRESKSLLDWMTEEQIALVRSGVGYDVTKRNAMLSAITAAWDSALTNGHDLYAPAGRYEIGDNSFPWRQEGEVSSLLDCGNVTVYGDGPATVFATYSIDGADVFQLNGLKNFHARDLSITATLTGSAASGSNGVSVTGGFDNITLTNIQCLNLPSLDKTSYVDGGKALTIQPGTTSNECGTLVARNIIAKGCAEGFGMEVALSTAATKRTAVDVELKAEDCLYGVKVVGAEATSALSAGMTMGLKVRAQAINCQKDLVLNRAHGVDVDVQVITTKTEAARRLSPSGASWFAADTTVEALHCAYAKNSRIRVYGNKGGCEYKARIGGAGAGSSGLVGRTEHCDIFLDVGGTATSANILEIDFGGNSMSSCQLVASNTTATSLPAAFYTTSLQNMLSVGPVNRLVDPTVAGQLTLAQAANGSTTTGAVMLKDSQITCLQGKATSSAGSVVAGMADSGGTVRLGIMNQNGLAIDVVTSTSTLGAYVGKFAVYKTDGTFIGYFPLYA